MHKPTTRLEGERSGSLTSTQQWAYWSSCWAVTSCRTAVGKFQVAAVAPTDSASANKRPTSSRRRSCTIDAKQLTDFSSSSFCRMKHLFLHVSFVGVQRSAMCVRCCWFFFFLRATGSREKEMDWIGCAAPADKCYVACCYVAAC